MKFVTEFKNYNFMLDPKSNNMDLNKVIKIFLIHSMNNNNQFIPQKDKAEIIKQYGKGSIKSIKKNIGIITTNDNYKGELLFKKENIKKDIYDKRILPILKRDNYRFFYKFLFKNKKKFWIFATKLKFELSEIDTNKLGAQLFELKDSTLSKDILKDIKMYGSEEEYPEPEVLPTEAPTIDPDYDDDPSIDPWETPPDLEPGQEPRPKAKAKKSKAYNEAIKYTSNSRMNKGLEDNIHGGKHPYAKSTAFPEYDKDEVKNFSELLAGDRFAELISKLRHYLEQPDFDQVDMMTMMQFIMNSYNEIIQIESANLKKLEKLAIKAVMEYFHIPEGKFLYDVKIVPMEEIDLSDIPKKPNFEKKLKNMPKNNPAEVFNIDDEYDKRMLLNALTQGAANKANYLFNLVLPEIKKINKALPNLYGLMISANDMNYWLFGDDMIEQVGKENKGAGKARIDLSTKPPTLIARGINLPILIHELTKALMEYLASYGLPKDKDQRKEVLDKTDFLDNEMWGLRFGPGLWHKFVEAIGAREEDIKHIIYTKIIKMKANEFNKFMKDLMGGKKAGKEKLVEMANEIRKTLKGEGFNKAMKKMKTKPKDINPDDVDISDLFK